MNFRCQIQYEKSITKILSEKDRELDHVFSARTVSDFQETCLGRIKKVNSPEGQSSLGSRSWWCHPQHACPCHPVARTASRPGTQQNRRRWPGTQSWRRKINQIHHQFYIKIATSNRTFKNRRETMRCSTQNHFPSSFNDNFFFIKWRALEMLVQGKTIFCILFSENL